MGALVSAWRVTPSGTQGLPTSADDFHGHQKVIGLESSRMNDDVQFVMFSGRGLNPCRRHALDAIRLERDILTSEGLIPPVIDNQSLTPYWEVRHAVLEIVLLGAEAFSHKCGKCFAHAMVGFIHR